jgi:hypothetical protein
VELPARDFSLDAEALAIQIQQVSRLRMSGDLPPLLHSFMLWCLIKQKDNFALHAEDDRSAVKRLTDTEKVA